MAKLEASVCPNCRAPLKLHGAMTEILCQYCGTLAHVQRGNEPPPMSPVGGPPMMVVRASPPAVPPVVWFIPAFVGIAIVATAALAASRHGGAPGTATGRGMFADSLMLGDVNGDGVPDLVGDCLDAQNHRLAAFDGATGKPLWQGPGTPMATRAGERAVVGDKLIAVDDVGKVQAYRLGNGAPAWAGLLGERVTEFCGDGRSVLIRTRDDAWTRFDLATGNKSPVTVPPLLPGARGEPMRPACTPAFATIAKTSPPYRLVEVEDFSANLPMLPTPEMLAVRALVPSEPGTTVMLGVKRPGSGVPMIAAIKNGVLMWKDVVPGVNPLTADPVPPVSAAVGDGKVVVPYSLRGGARMACFDARTGVRLWDVELHKEPKKGLAIAAGRVYYATGAAAYALSLANGAPIFAVGHEL